MIPIQKSDKLTRAQVVRDQLHAKGYPAADAARLLGVSETTIYRYRRQARVDDGERLTSTAACQPSKAVMMLCLMLPKYEAPALTDLPDALKAAC